MSPFATEQDMIRAPYGLPPLQRPHVRHPGPTPTPDISKPTQDVPRQDDPNQDDPGPHDAPFTETRDTLAHTFLTQLDQTLTSSLIAQRTAPTGGVHLIWNPHFTTSTPTVPAYAATIELSSKILTDEERLRSTLAREFCHVAVGVVDQVPRGKHGGEFEAWGRRCEAVFGEMGVRVTKRHDYELEWKYVWACAGTEGELEWVRDGEGEWRWYGGCGVEVGRQKKRIDVEERRVCGHCGGRLRRVKPLPEELEGGGGEGEADGGASEEDEGSEGEDSDVGQTREAEWFNRLPELLSKCGHQL
ncbi:SprT-like family-domain-containing protein [Elsinoe ampelina]|uniref:SprT-like family-domain-containing protein n=1 Tax=Elsinoe ampelina TaxID=302913 RepID=A0A6A6GQI2_9PEZI|nr:SprT-like family-domain-containing protein [Elsinoe ampelina]